jgi:hypothetical protein
MHLDSPEIVARVQATLAIGPADAGDDPPPMSAKLASTTANDDAVSLDLVIPVPLASVPMVQKAEQYRVEDFRGASR